MSTEQRHPIPDVNKPVENPKLSTLLHQLKDTDKDHIASLYESIAEEIATNAYLLAVIKMDPDSLERKDDGSSVIKKGTTLAFEFLSTSDGTTFIPVFTDWSELRKWDKYKTASVQTLIVSFDDLAAITAGKGGIAVNPFSDNFVIRPEIVIHMKQHKDIVTKGYSEKKIKENTTVHLGDPSPYPTAMVEAIKDYAGKNDGINTLWLKLMINGDEKSFLIIVDAEDSSKEYFKGIADIAGPFLEKGMYIDMVPLSSDFGKKAAEGEPIYKKEKHKKWKLFGR